MKPEIITISNRKFHIFPTRPGDKQSSWTFKEELADGTLVKPDDIMGCYAPLGFVKHHIKSSIKE